MGRIASSSAARQVAAVLREEILGAEADESEWFLGSEEDLMAWLGVSRPTLRQASRLLEQEQLLDVRRGVHGGFYGRRPTFEVVTHTASLFLRSQGAVYADLMRSQIALSSACAELAAGHPDIGERRRAATWYAEQLSGDIEDLDGTEFFAVCSGFHRLLAELTGHLTLQLFVDVLLELARPVALDSFVDRTAIERTATDHQIIGEAILVGDAEQASALMRSHLEHALTWADASRPLASP